MDRKNTRENRRRNTDRALEALPSTHTSHFNLKPNRQPSHNHCHSLNLNETPRPSPPLHQKPRKAKLIPVSKHPRQHRRTSTSILQLRSVREVAGLSKLLPCAKLVISEPQCTGLITSKPTLTNLKKILMMNQHWKL